MVSVFIEDDISEFNRRPAPSRVYSERVQQIRSQVHVFAEFPESGVFAKLSSIFILLVIISSICCFVLETVQAWQDNQLWSTMEIFSTMAFTIEYLLRLWSCDVFGGQSIWQFVSSPMNVLDLMAIMPFYIELIMTSADIKGLRVLRAIRLIRLFRVFKLGRYNSGMLLMTTAVKNSLQALSILVFFLAIGVILFSSLLYYAEKLSCPQTADWTVTEIADYVAACEFAVDGYTKGLGGLLCCDKNSNQIHFPSILETMWWSVVTMTTVGFGDQVPRTELGRLIAGISMICGILLISLPVAIVGNKFQEAYDEQHKEQVSHKRNKTKMFARDTTVSQQSRSTAISDSYRSSNFMHLHRKLRVEHIQAMIKQLSTGDTKKFQVKARTHLSEIALLLQETAKLEKEIAVLKSQDRKTEQKIAKALEQLLTNYTDGLTFP